MRKVVIVDADDRPIGLKSYADIANPDIIRVSALWLADTESEEYLLTQRKWTKHVDPGKWMGAVSGTIEEGETYDENIVHEIEEEIGLTGLVLEKGPKEYIDDGNHKLFVQWYLSKVDKKKTVIQLQEDEVEDYRWISKEQLIKELASSPAKFVPPIKKNLISLGIIESHAK